MKNKLIFILSSLFLLAGCAKEFTYIPKHGGLYIPTEEENGGSESGGGGSGGGSGSGSGGESETGGDDDDDVLLCTYQIYFSYSHTTKYNPETKKDEESPILSFTAPMLSPLGAIPEEINTEEKVLAKGAELGYAVDPAFPTFLGFSFNGLCLDESGLWDFTKDYKQLAVVTLYGIWVSNE